MSKQDIITRFPKPRKKVEQLLRDSYLKMALILLDRAIDSREKTIAIERLEESYMWALKGLLYEDED